MVINEIRNGDTLTVIPEDRLDTISSPELDAFLKKNYPAINELIVDCSKLSYISSAGLRVLLIAKKTLADKVGVRILNANPLIMEVFKVTGMIDLFVFE